jgi:peptidoglycan/LPS O-acetylase OafA/YrhL
MTTLEIDQIAVQRRASGPKPAFLAEVHRLRAVAIMMIVAAHCYQAFTWNSHPATDALFKDAFDNSSLIFIFVAGFLFQRTEAHRFRYLAYLLRKFRNVIAPFLIALTPAVAYALLRGTTALAVEPPWGSSVPAKLLLYAVYPGQTMNYALWFIPMIAIYYLASPALHQLDRRRWHWLLGLLVPLSVLLHRPSYSYGHNLSLAAYFLSAFVLGMAFSCHWGAVLGWLERFRWPLWMLFATVFIGHLVLSDHHGKSTTIEPFETQGTDGLIDWVYAQKMLMVVVLVDVSHSFRERSARVLDFIADASFTIFFYHLYFIYVARWFVHFAPVEFRPDYFLALFALSIAGPCAIALVVRTILPRWSRMLVGAN